MAVTRRVRLLTLVGPGGRRDVVAAAEASLVYLFPVFVDLVGDGETPADSPRWGLYDVQGQVLRRTSTLLAEQVVDGAVLTLAATPPAGPPPVPHPDVRPTAPDPAAPPLEDGPAS